MKKAIKIDKKPQKNAENLAKNTSIRGLDEEGSFKNDLGIPKTLFSSETGAGVDTLYQVVKSVPEVVGCFNAIVEDIMSDGYKFISPTNTKKHIKEAEGFAINANMYKVMANSVWECLTTGNSYVLKLSVNEENIKSLIKTLETKEVRKFVKSAKPKELKETIFEIVNQNLSKPVDLQLLKSSTMTINYDETGKVISYQQRVGARTRIYRPQDIIHTSLINIGGGAYGFTPLEPLLSDIATLIFAKEYVGKYFENDGVPHFMFLMPEENPDSPNYKKLQQELKNLKDKAQKFRSLVLTGNVTATEISKMDKDMEFSNLIMHFTQIVIIALGVPPQRVNLTLNKQQGGDVNRAFEGYYKKINFLQRIIEHSFNKHLFGAFNVRLAFNQAYKIDEMREAQIAQIMSQIGAMTIEEIRERIGMNPEIPKGTMGNRTGDENNINFDEDKRRTQGRENNPESPDKNTDNKLKNIHKSEMIINVPFVDFVRIVEGVMGANNFNKAKIFYKETGDKFTLFWSDGQWKYLSVVSKQNLDVMRFKVERLSGAIKIESISELSGLMF